MATSVLVYVEVMRSCETSTQNGDNIGRPTNQLKCNGSVRGASWIRGARVSDQDRVEWDHTNRISKPDQLYGSHEADERTGACMTRGDTKV